jgi:hypothetical protein
MSEKTDKQVSNLVELDPHLLGQMNLPKRFWEYEAKDLSAELQEKIKNFAKPLYFGESLKDVNLFLFGKEFTQSEHAMTVVLKAVRRWKFWTYCISMHYLKSFIESEMIMADDLPPFEFLKQVEVLGIYRVGNDDFNDFGKTDTYLSQIIQYRYDNVKPTIISSCLNIEGVNKKFSAMVGSIIAEAYVGVEING